MQTKNTSIAVIITVVFLSIVGYSFIYQASAAIVQVEYKYNAIGICQGATAALDSGALVGKAALEDLVKGQYYLVRETHYSPSSGSIIYEGLSRFSIHGGMKIGEERLRGQKITEIFGTWPSSGLGEFGGFGRGY